MAAARQKEMKESATVVATTTFAVEERCASGEGGLWFTGEYALILATRGRLRSRAVSALDAGRDEFAQLVQQRRSIRALLHDLLDVAVQAAPILGGDVFRGQHDHR